MGNLNNKNPDKIKIEGIVLETLPSLKFKVKLDNGKEIIAHLAGRLRMYRIKILAGDKVTVEMSPYDENRGRIVYRGK
ncbi:MAG: translation initiation factor IF-1 [Minisyncoccales bacterium]